MVFYKKLLAIDMSKLRPYSTYYPVQYDYVSQLPESWKLLPNIAIFQERKEKGGEDLDSLSVSAIKGIVRASDYEDRKDRTSEDKSEYLIVHKGDIPYNTMLMWAGAIGRSEYKGIVSPAYTVLKPKPKVEINTKYFHYMFRLQFYKDYTKRFSYGIVDSRLRLYYTYFKRMYSIFPPIETQNTIVEYLDQKTAQIQEFITKKERLVELLEEQKTNSIRHVLTKGIKSQELKDSGIEWIGKIPSNWDIIQLRYLCKIDTGSKNTEDRVDDGKYPFFVRSQTPERINSYSYDGEAILTAGDGAGVGKVFHYINGKFDYHQRVYKFSSFKGVLGKYLFYYLKVNFFYVALLGEAKSTVDSLRLPVIKSFNIVFPVSLTEQQEILDEIESISLHINNAISRAKLEIEKAKEFQESLITQVVTGQLQVPMSELGLEGLKENRIIKSSSSGQEVLKSSNPQILISSNPKNPNPDNI